MSSFKVNDFVWAKMTGYPYWPGKIVIEDKDVKKPKGKSEMHYVRFYGTGDHAWTKVELMKQYEEHKEQLSTSYKRTNFLEAVKDIEQAFDRRSKGLPDSSEEEDSDPEESDDEPLSKRAKNGKSTSDQESKNSSGKKKKRKSMKKVLPTREQLTLHHHDLSHYLLTRSLETSSPGYFPRSTNRRQSAKESFEGARLNSPSKSTDIKLAQARRSPDSTADADSTTQYTPREVLATDKKIGFIGLGIMGSAMSMNMVRTGHDVTVWNRRQDRCAGIVKAGAKQGTSPADVVQQCDITFCCVSDPAAVRDVVIGNNGVLQGITSGKGFVDMSTIDAETVKDMAEAVCMRGGRYLEAPISGAKKPAEQGQLIILAAGDRSLYMDCYSCFEAMGKKTFFLGELGNGAKSKLVINMMEGSFMASLAEGLSLAEKAGLDQYMLLEILNLGALACPLVSTKGAAILEGHFPANFPLRHMQKDMRLALQVGEELEQPLHIAGAANELFKRSKAMGYGDRDVACVYRAINA